MPGQACNCFFNDSNRFASAQFGLSAQLYVTSAVSDTAVASNSEFPLLYHISCQS